MRICWDNIEKLTFNKKLKVLRHESGMIYYFKDHCKKCNEPFLGLLKSKYCNRICSAKDRPKMSKQHRENISKSISGNKNGMYKKKHTLEAKQKIRIANSGRICSEETKEKMRRANSGENSFLWKGGYYTRGLPMYKTYAEKLSIAEEVRKNKEDKNILEIKCTYCGNWFIPEISQVYERCRSLNFINCGENRFYCSDKCKQECSIFWQQKYPKGYKSSSVSREVQPELRQMRFEIDNYTCQKCGKHQDELEVGLHCHHVEGIRWEPLESADLDKCITVCKDCHKKIHKIEGCRYSDMQCKEE